MSDENSDKDVSEIGSANEQLVAVCEENRQAQGEECKTEAPSMTSEEEASMRLPSGLAEERREPRSCSHCNSSTLRSVEEKCMFCLGEANYTSQKNTTATLESFAASPVTTDGLFLGAPPSSVYAASLPSLPDTSLEDGAYSTPRQQRVEDLVTGRSRDGKTPVDNFCRLSVQTPSPGLTIRIFLHERTFPERNEKVFTLYVIPEGECLVYEEICQKHKEEASQQGYSRQIPFAVNNCRSQEFHTLYIQEQISVSFGIENRYQENFITPDQRSEVVFRVLGIKSECHNRVAKGAKCSFRVQYVGEPGKPCQEQGIITLSTDSHLSEETTTLFFSIAIWSSVDVRFDGDEQD